MANTDLNISLKLNDQASAQALGIISKMKGANVRLEQSQKRVNGAVRSGSAAFTQLRNVFIGLGVGKVLRDTVNAAVEFEDAFAGVRKTVDASEEEFQQLSDGLRQLSLEIPVAATDLARIQELAGQLGVTGVEELTKFTDTIAKIAVTTNLTQDSAATSFARIANIMQTPIKEIDRMGSSVVELGNNFATTEAEVLEFANRIAGAGQVVGLSEADIFAFGAAFSSVGVRAERGGTAVSKSLIKISQAVNNGGRDLRKFAKVSNLTVEEFSRLWREDAGKAFALFIEGLGRSGQEGAKILEDLELGDQRLVQSFLSVGGATGILTDALDQASEAYKENNALNEEAAKRFETTKSTIQAIKNQFTDLRIELGNRTLPVFNEVLVWAKDWNKFAKGLGKDFTLTGKAIIGEPTQLEKLNEEYDNTVKKIEFLEKKARSNLFGIIPAALFGESSARAKYIDNLNKSKQDLAIIAKEINIIESSAQRASDNLQSNRLAGQFGLSSLEESGITGISGVSDAFGNAGISGVDAFSNPLQNEEELLQQKRQIRESDVQSLAETENRKIGILGSFFRKAKELLSGNVDEEANTQKERITIFGETMALMNALQKSGSKESFKITQALAITESIVNAHKGIARAFGEHKFPKSAIIAAIVGARAFAEVAAIKAQKFHKGGIIGEQGNGPEQEVPIIAQTGEGILSRRGVNALGTRNLDRLNRGEDIAGGVNVNIDIANLSLNGVSDVEDFGQIIATEIEQGLRYPRG